MCFALGDTGQQIQVVGGTEVLRWLNVPLVGHLLLSGWFVGPVIAEPTQETYRTVLNYPLNTIIDAALRPTS